MINNDIEKNFLEVLKNIEVPESRYENAIKSYTSVGEWLNREESTLKDYKPRIYSQGSFRLGTAIKPISEEDEYDVDIVCELELKKINITQKQLKEMVGEELDKYVKFRKIKNELAEGKRCWTLNYSDESKFHIDVLPSIPNNKQLKILLEKNKFQNVFSETAIDITDNTLPNYDKIDELWKCSNPIGYHNWFKDRMKTIYIEKRNILKESFYKNKVEEVPEYKIKTPLQQVIQLLKRHRDVMFEEDNSDNKPISIIITTLAAKSYNNEPNLIDAFKNIINNMEKYIEKRDEVYWVENPVNQLENFADKWQSNPERKDMFFKWINQLKKDYSNLENSLNLNIDKREIYAVMFGKSINPDSRLIVSNVPEYKLMHKKPLKWNISLNQVDCDIVAYKFVNGYRKAKFNSGEPLLKNTKLRFEIKSNAQGEYKIYWRVTNTGEEANRARCLRGEFYESSIKRGKKIREESTAYKGTHTVECFIIKGDLCIGNSKPFIVNVI